MKSCRIYQSFLALTLTLAAAPVFSQVYLDVEEDPVPLFDLTVILPTGTASSDPKEAVNFALLQSMMEAGTMRKNRETFNDMLGDFGASFSFSMAGQYSTWSLSFPHREGQDYKKLIWLLQENWETPRLTQEEFKRYQTMGLNNIKASLNNDGPLATGTVRRWLYKKFLGFSPVFQESYAWANLKSIQDLYQKRVKTQSEIWAGFVGPSSMKPLVKEVITQVFGKLEFKEGKYLQQLPTRNPATVGDRPHSKDLWIIAKPGRTQNMTALYAISPKKLTPATELDFLIGDHVAASGGLNSLYGEALRTRGGFSYQVSSTASPSFAGYPILGFVSNPMSSKQDAAMTAIAGLLKETYNGSLFTGLSSSDWNTRVKSYRYEKTFAEMTPDARMSERQAVVMGIESPELYKSDPLDWNASPKEVQTFFGKHWNDSQIMMAIVGDPKELTEVAKKHFPDFRVKIVPYVDTISAKTFD